MLISRCLVNTRCLYLRLFTEDFEHSNLTLAPIVDFANHASSPNLPSLQPLVLENTNAKKRRVFREIDKFTFCSPLLPVKAKDELFLKYGDHCNKTLFTEYGFVDPGSVGDGEVDVADVVNELIRGANDSRGNLKRFLEDYGYIQYAILPAILMTWLMFVSTQKHVSVRQSETSIPILELTCCTSSDMRRKGKFFG